LQLIESGSVDDLSRHAASLLLTVLPSLEFANDVLELGLEPVNQSLHRQLESGTGSGEKK